MATRRSDSKPGVAHARGAPAASSDTWLDLAVDLLAAYRLTRLATADLISEPIRQVVVRGAGARPAPGAEHQTAQEMVAGMDEAPKLATLVTCRWCAGVWIGLGVVAARRLAPRAWEPLARGLAVSAGAVLLARLEDA